MRKITKKRRNMRRINPVASETLQGCFWPCIHRRMGPGMVFVGTRGWVPGPWKKGGADPPPPPGVVPGWVCFSTIYIIFENFGWSKWQAVPSGTAQFFFPLRNGPPSIREILILAKTTKKNSGAFGAGRAQRVLHLNNFRVFYVCYHFFPNPLHFGPNLGFSHQN